jgi:hypothetical protein
MVWHFFNSLASSNSRPQRAQIVSQSTPHEMAALVELVANTLAGNISLNAKERRRLRSHRRNLRRMSKFHSARRARQFLVQHGGFSPALLVPIITQVASGVASELLLHFLRRNNENAK